MKRLISVFSAAMLTALSAFFITCTDSNSPTAPQTDVTPPAILWVSPAGGSELSGNITLAFDIYDASPLDSIRLYLNGFPAENLNPIPLAPPSYNISWDTRSLSDGIYILELRAWDSSGNLGISPSLVVKVANNPPPPEDREPPVVLWLSPEAGSRLKGLTVLRFQAMDNMGIDSIRMYLNGAMSFEIAGHTEINYEVEWNTTELADGLYSIEIRASDEAGNFGTAPAVTVTVANNPHDTTPPDVWWVSPNGGATLTDTVTLQVRVFDESGVDSVALYLNGAFRNAGVPAGNEYEYLWDTHADSDGVHLLSAVAWDSAGNEGQSQALLVNVDNIHLPPEGDHKPPVIAWLSPEPGDTVEGTVDLRFNVLDNDAVDSVKVYLNGRTFQTFADADTLFNYELQWATDETEDGNYIFQVKAWDRSLNVGLSEVVWFHVWNDRPKVIWVPDDYETIQGAINASVDGDTVRVRAGVYEEEVRVFNRKIWLESSDGPENTLVLGVGRSNGISARGDNCDLIVRGFTVCGEFNCLLITDLATITVYNCVLRSIDPLSPSRGALPYTGNLFIYNSIIDSIRSGEGRGLAFGYVEGCAFNCIIVDCLVGLYKIAVYDVDFNYGWNILFQNDINYKFIVEPGEGDIIEDPLFQEATYRLSPTSPGIDAGHPDILDRDGSRSDIGLYGGPYSYPINQ